MSDMQYETSMQADRVAAFSDGVIAIIVTIMVLELHPPHSGDPAQLLRMWPTLGAYGLSFALVSIYWVNHHQLLHANRRMNITCIWLNIHWLFWLSLFPFATSYVSATKAASLSLAFYAGLGIVTATAYRLLASAIGRINAAHEDKPDIGRARRRLNSMAIMSNVLAIPAAYYQPEVAIVLLILPAVSYFIPTKFATSI